jgi:hypothetical protein
MFHPAYFQDAFRLYGELLAQLKLLSGEKKFEFAKKNKELLLGLKTRIPEFFALLSDEEQLDLLNKRQGPGITEHNLAAILKNILLPANKLVVAADNDTYVTENNLIDIALALFSEAEDRLTYLVARLNKITPLNLVSAAKIIPLENQENFIETCIDRLTISNISEVIILIAPSKQLQFLNDHPPLIDSRNIYSLASSLPADDRTTFILCHTDKVHSRNIAVLTALLEEKERQMFVIGLAQHVNSDNFVAILSLGSIEIRTVWLANFSPLINANNFKNIIGHVPQEFQLAFLELNERFLVGKSRGVWGEHVAMLIDKNDRYTFFQSHQLQMCNPQEDICSVAWVMEQFSTQHALELGKKHVHQINDVDQIRAFLNCNTLDLASRVALIEAYKPTMLKQADKADQTLKIRKYLAEQLKLATGKEYPRGDKTDLQGLNILINLAKQHLEIKTSNHDPKIFVSVCQQPTLAMDVSEQYRPSA